MSNKSRKYQNGVVIRMNASENSVNVYGTAFNRKWKQKRLVNPVTGEEANYKRVRDHVCEMKGITA